MKFNLKLCLLLVVAAIGGNAYGELVLFKTPEGKHIYLELRRGETYGYAKAMLAEQLGVDVDRIILVNRGRSMQNEYVLDFENAPNMGMIKIKIPAVELE